MHCTRLRLVALTCSRRSRSWQSGCHAALRTSSDWLSAAAAGHSRVVNGVPPTLTSRASQRPPSRLLTAAPGRQEHSCADLCSSAGSCQWWAGQTGLLTKTLEELTPQADGHAVLLRRLHRRCQPKASAAVQREQVHQHMPIAATADGSIHAVLPAWSSRLG